MRGGLSKKTCIKCSTYPITVSLQSCWYFRTILQTGRLRFRAPKGCLRGRLDFSTRLLSTCSISWPPPPPHFNDVISAALAQMPFLSNWCFYLFIFPTNIYWGPSLDPEGALCSFSITEPSPMGRNPEWERITPHTFSFCAMSLLVINASHFPDIHSSYHRAL